MYCEFFGLSRSPFNNTPDPTFYFNTPEHQEALATLEYAVMQRKGFVLLTGEVGAGKTLIGRMFLRKLEAQAATATISQTYLSPRQLLEALCHELEVPLPEGDNPLRVIQRLQEYLLDRFSRDGRVVVLIDEAQNLPVESFETLRMLGNLEADDAKLLQVCLLGQPELRERFRRPELKQLDQRLFCRFHLSVLDREQTTAYIQHRMKVAGSEDPGVFTPIACEKIFVASRGTPRLINTLCDNALLTAYGQNQRVIDEQILRLMNDREALHAAPVEHRAAATNPVQHQPRPATTNPTAEPTPPAPAPIEPEPEVEVETPEMKPSATAVHQQTGRAVDGAATLLEARVEELRRLSLDMKPALRDTTLALEGLQRHPASGQLEAIRLQHQANVAGLVRRFNTLSQGLREIKDSIRPGPAETPELEAQRADVARQVLKMARELGGLRQELLESCGRIHAQMNRLAARKEAKPAAVPLASKPMPAQIPTVTAARIETPESTPMSRVPGTAPQAEEVTARPERNPATIKPTVTSAPPVAASSIAAPSTRAAGEALPSQIAPANVLEPAAAIEAGASSETQADHREDMSAATEILSQLDTVGTENAMILALSRRLEQLEKRLAANQAATSQPVQMQLMPELSVQLAGLIETARREHDSFREDLERAAMIAASLQEASSQIQEVMQDWVTNATAVQEQSDQLRASSKVATEILNAMRRCNNVLEEKISSERWQTEVERGETLTTRMEQATRGARAVCQQLSTAISSMEQLRGEADHWNQRGDEARHMGDRLQELLSEAQNTTARFEEAMEARRGLLTAIARNTAGLVKVIDSARRGDEERRPNAGGAADEEAYSEINWPRIRTPQVAAS